MRCSCLICRLPVSLSLTLSVLHVARELLHVNKLEFDGSQLGYNWIAQCSRIMSRERAKETTVACSCSLWPGKGRGTFDHICKTTQNAQNFSQKAFPAATTRTTRTAQKLKNWPAARQTKGEARGGKEKTENWNNYKKCCVVLLFVVVLWVCEHTDTHKLHKQRERCCNTRQLVKATIYSL